MSQDSHSANHNDSHGHGKSQGHQESSGHKEHASTSHHDKPQTAGKKSSAIGPITLIILFFGAFFFIAIDEIFIGILFALLAVAIIFWAPLKGYFEQELEVVSEAEGYYPKNLGGITKTLVDETGDMLSPQERHTPEHGHPHGLGTDLMGNINNFLSELNALFSGGSGGGGKKSNGHGGGHH